MKEETYRVDIEVEVLPTSETYNSEYDGGRMVCFVSSFCLASDKQDAIGRTKMDLTEQDITLLRVNSIEVHEEYVWEGGDSEENPNEYASEAAETGQVIYSIFSCYIENPAK